MFSDALKEIWIFISEPLAIGTLVLPFSVLRIFLEFLLPLLVSQIFLHLVHKMLVRLIDRSKLAEEHRKTISRIVRIVFRIIGVTIFVILVTLLFGAEFLSVFSAITSILSEPFFTSGELRISIMTLVAAVPVFLLAAWIGKGTRKLVENSILRRLPVDESIRFSISNIVGYSTMLLMIIVGLSFVGINLSSLVVMFGVLGIGIGFGLQNTVANFFSGLIIIISRPIKEGDFILANTSKESIEGSVSKITLLHSVVSTVYNETIIIPNAEIVNRAVHNMSYDSTEIIILVCVQVHYDSDIDKVEELLIAVSKGCPYWNKQDEARVIIRDFASSGIELGLLLRISNAREQLKAKAWLRKAIWRCFKDEGIVIPYPQIDVHLPGKGIEP